MKIGLPKGDNYKLVLAGLQPCQRTFIECLVNCSETELVIHLESFTQWVWEKSDVICWAPVLNRFDAIIERYVSSYNEFLTTPDIPLEKSFSWDLVQLVKNILKTSIMIVENCTSKSMYNSLELLVMLLDDINPDIVLLTTRLLCVFFSTRNRKNAPHREASCVANKLSSLVQSPLPEKTMKFTLEPEETPEDGTNSPFNVGTSPQVLQMYLDSKPRLLTIDSTIEIGTNDSIIQIPVVDVYNCSSVTSCAEVLVASVNHAMSSTQQLRSALQQLHASFATQETLYQHLWRTLQMLIAKYKIKQTQFTDLKYKVIKVYGCIYPPMMKANVNIRLSSLICMLLMNNSLYNQFLGYNPSFLLELCSFIKSYKVLQRQTMMLATELLSGMIYDGIQYKALSNLLGFNVPHGIFVKVLLVYLEHAHSKEPLPPVLDLKTSQEMDMDGKHAYELNERRLLELQTNGFIVDGGVVLGQYRWQSRITNALEHQMVLEKEDDMRILLQLLIVYYSIISYHGSNNVLVNNTVLEAIVGFIRVRDPIYLPVVIYVVQVLEALLDYNQTVSRCLRNDLDLFFVFVSRLQYDMYNIAHFPIFGLDNAETKHWPSGWRLPQTLDPMQLRFYWLSLSENSARRFLFKTIIKDLDSAARSFSGRNEVREQDVFAQNSPIIPIMHYIFKDVQNWGLGIYSAAITLVSDTLGEDPIAQEELHKFGILPAILSSICEDNLKCEDCLSIVPTAISDVFLHRSGQEYMRLHDYAPVLKLIDIVTNRDFVLYDRFGEVCASIGSCLDAIVRNNEGSLYCITRRIIAVMVTLLQEAQGYPRFEPMDAKECERQAQADLKELCSKPTAITISLLYTLEEHANDPFYPDRVANLGKMLLAFLTAAQSISHFVSMDGVKLLLQLGTVPCLPPMFALIYPQHPLALAIKYITAHSAPPCVTQLHAMCRTCLARSTLQTKVPRSTTDVQQNVREFKTLHCLCHFLYFMHRESTSFYHQSCIGQFQTSGAVVAGTCEVHLTLSLFLKRMVNEFPMLMKQFFTCINAAGVETVLSGGHHSHDHPQIKAHKLHAAQTKMETLFSANDLFWSSQCKYAYSIPNPSFVFGANSWNEAELPPEYASLNSEMCRLVLITIKALINAINVAAAKSLHIVKLENACLREHVGNHVALTCAIVLNLFKGLPMLDLWKPGDSLFLESMNEMMVAQYLVESLEIVYKLLIDTRGPAGLHFLTFILFENMGGIDALVRVYNYLQAMYIAAAVAMVIKLDPDVNIEDLFLHDSLPPQTFGFMKCMAEGMVGNMSLRGIKSCMVVLLKALQVTLNLFSKIVNSRTILNSHCAINLHEYLNSDTFKNFVTKDATQTFDICLGAFNKMVYSSWNWFKVLVRLPSECPSNSCASIHFYTSPKLIGALLKVFIHFIEFSIDARQILVKDHISGFGESGIDEQSRTGAPRGSTYPTMNYGSFASRQRQRRHRNLATGSSAIATSNDVDVDTQENHDMRAARTHLMEMGFSERDISNAIAHVGYSDVTTLTDWLINSLSYNSDPRPLSEYDDDVSMQMETVDASMSAGNSTSAPNTPRTLGPSASHSGHSSASSNYTRQQIVALNKNLGLFPDSMQLSNAVDGFAQSADDLLDIWECSLYQPYQYRIHFENANNLYEEILNNVVDGILKISGKASTSCNVLVDCLTRLMSMDNVVYENLNVPPIFNVPRSHQETNVAKLLWNIVERIQALSAELFAQVDQGHWGPGSGSLPTVFVDEQERLAALATVLNEQVSVSVGSKRSMYATQRLQEQLFGLYHILVFMASGKENFASLFLSFGTEPMQITFDLIAKSIKALTPQLMQVKMASVLPNCPVLLVPAALQTARPKGYSADDLSYGFYKTGPLPQEMVLPQFIRLGLVFIAEVSKEYNLVDIPRELASVFTGDIHEKDLPSGAYIPSDMQRGLVNLSLQIFELFPCLDSDVVYSLLKLLDSLTEQYSNALEFVSYSRIRNIPLKSGKLSQKLFGTKSDGCAALSILLTLDRSTTCKGMLKMIANILLHCMENPEMFRETVRIKLLECLSPRDDEYANHRNHDEDFVPLGKFIEAIRPFVVRHPKVVAETIAKYCVLVRADAGNVCVTLASNPRVCSDDMEPLGQNNNDLHNEIPRQFNYKRAFHLMRCIVDHMQMYANLHGITRTTDSKTETWPVYPFALSLNSLLYLFASFYHNFPICAMHGPLHVPKLDIVDVPYAKLPWRLLDLWGGTLKGLVVVLIRRIFLMIAALVGPESIYCTLLAQDVNSSTRWDFEVQQRLIVGTLDNFTNAALLLASTSIHATNLILENATWVLQLYLNQEPQECGPHLLPMSIYSLCNMINVATHLRFPDGILQMPGDLLVKMKKTICALVNKLDLHKDGNTVVCTEIIRCLVAISTPNKTLALASEGRNDIATKAVVDVGKSAVVDGAADGSRVDAQVLGNGADVDEEDDDVEDVDSGEEVDVEEEDDDGIDIDVDVDVEEGDVADDDVVDDEEEEEEEDISEDDDEEDVDSGSDIVSDDDDDDTDEDDDDSEDEEDVSSDSAIEEDLASDIEDDVEMALPHQVDEDYPMNHQDSASTDNSSIDEVGEDDDEDDDDAPRIRVVGELDENAVQDAAEEDEIPLLAIAEEDMEHDSDYSASPSDGFEQEPARASADTASSDTFRASNINQESTEQNRTIHIEIQFGDNQGMRYNLSNPSSNVFMEQGESRNVPSVNFASNSPHGVKSDSWYTQGDLNVPYKNPALPPTKRYIGKTPDVEGDLLVLLGKMMRKVTAKTLPVTTPKDAAKDESTNIDVDSNVMQQDDNDTSAILSQPTFQADDALIDVDVEADVVDAQIQTPIAAHAIVSASAGVNDATGVCVSAETHQSSCTSTGGDPAAVGEQNVLVISRAEDQQMQQEEEQQVQPQQQQRDPNAYFNPDLDRIATALGITFNDLFAVANMDPSVIAELPSDMLQEILIQQLNTISVDAVESIRNSRTQAQGSDAVTAGVAPRDGAQQQQQGTDTGPATATPTSPPPATIMPYLEALPRSLRLEAVRALYGEGSNEINAAMDFDGSSAGVLASLGPSVRQEFLSAAGSDFWDSIAANLLTGHGRNLYTRSGTARARSHVRGGHSSFSRDNARELTAQQQTAENLATGLTLGFIIGEIRDANQMRQRNGLGNNQRHRSGLNRNRVGGISNRRARGIAAGAGTSRGALQPLNSQLGDFIFLDNRIPRTRSSFDTLPHQGITAVSNNHRAGSSTSDDHVDRQNQMSFGGPLFRSIPHLLNSFQPQLLNFVQQPASRGGVSSGTNFSNRGIGNLQGQGQSQANYSIAAAAAAAVAASASASASATTGVDSSGEAYPNADPNNDGHYGNLLETLLKSIPTSATEMKPKLGTRVFLEFIKGTRCDLTLVEATSIVKMLYLRQELNKKLLFKLLYNLLVAGGNNVDLLLKLLLQVLNASIVNLEPLPASKFEEVATYLLNPQGFPPRQLYGSSPRNLASYADAAGTATAATDNGIGTNSHGHPHSGGVSSSSGFGNNSSGNNNNMTLVAIGSSCASYTSSERALEQLRSILIAMPFTAAFFAKDMSSSFNFNASPSGETARRKKKHSKSGGGGGVYPINLLLWATGSHLFQSSVKHMNHLVMTLHNLLVVPVQQASGQSRADATATASAGVASTLTSPASNTRGPNVEKDQGIKSPKHATDGKLLHHQILEVLDPDAVCEFLRVFCSWRVQSNYILHGISSSGSGSTSNNKDSPAQHHITIVAQVIASIYKEDVHKSHVDAALQFHLVNLANEIISGLQTNSVVLCRDSEIEQQLSTLLRLVNLINEMFNDAFKDQVHESGKALHLVLLANFYSTIPLGPLWEAMDDKLVKLSPIDGSAPSAINAAGTSSPGAGAGAGAAATSTTTIIAASEDVHVNTEALTVLEPLIEAFFQIWQNAIALEYKLKNVQDLDQTISLVNFDADIPKSTNFNLEAASPKRILELETSNISPSHGTLIGFAERHRRAIGILVKQNPSLLSTGFQPLIRLAPLCLCFETKRQYFRQKLKEQRQGLRLDTIRLNVRRERIFLDSYHQLRSRSGDEMKGKLSVVFGGEEGVDAGGLTREWFAILAKEMFNPNYGLFRREGRKQEFNHPNPLSGINPDHLNFFKFIGRIIGKALYDGHHLDAYFCRSFYKHMLGRKITPADAESVDPQFFSNLMSLTKYTLEEMGLELFFSTEIDEFGKLKVIDLIPNGRNIPVTEDNKHRYIELLCQHKVTNGIKDQLDAFMDGFYELISPKLISIFDDKELELLISGIPIIDLKNLKENVDYVNYDANSDQIKWLWEFLEQLDQNHLAAFLQFVTGTSRVPIGGFKNLMGMRGPQKISIHRTFGDDRLPSAHTCFNQLDLPAYSQRQLLFDKLLQAIVEGKEGFGFI